MIAITGANGFFGAHLCAAAVRAGLKTVAVCRKSSDTTFIQQLFGFYQLDYNQIEWRYAELSDTDALFEAFQQVNRVIHCAGKVTFSGVEYDSLLEVNRDGTKDVVNAALEAGVASLDYISSIAALESQNYKLEKGGWNAFKKQNPYGFSKYLGGLEVQRGKEEGLAVSIIHPGVIIGACANNSPIGKVWQRLKKGVKKYPTGSTGFTPAKQGADAVIQLQESKEMGVVLVQENYSFQQVLSTFGDVFGVSVPTKPISSWVGKLAVLGAGIIESLGLSKTITRMGIESLFTQSSYETSERISSVSLEETLQEIKRFQDSISETNR